MKKYLRLIFFFLMIVFSTPKYIHANVYASQLKISNPDGSEFDGSFTDGSGAALSFILNDDASSVIIKIKDASDGSVITEKNAGALTRGAHSYEWDGTGAASGKAYIFEVTASQPNYSNIDWTLFFDSGGVDIFSRGVDVVTDMSSPFFGLMYAPNNDGPLGKGITIYNPDGTHSDPFLVAADLTSGGSIDWGTGDPMIGGIFDDLGRFYVSSIQFGEIRRMDSDYSITPAIGGFSNPLGIAIRGTGDERTIYFCSDNKIFSAKIGNNDTFNDFAIEVGVFENRIPRCIALDDEGNLYVAFRANATDLNSVGLGLYKYSLSGSLPVGNNDHLWGVDAALTHRISDILFDYGSDRNSNADDILYYATRADVGNNDDGIWRLNDINSPFLEPVKIITEIELYGGDDNINARSGLALDAAGNLILFENANEHIFFVSPPGDAAENSFTTTSPDSIKVSGATSADDLIGSIPVSYSLNQNYPNPFNPSTIISYHLPEGNHVTLKVFDLLGREVASLADEWKNAGIYSYQFNAGDLSSGIYIYNLKAGDKTYSKKMSLLK